MENLLSSINFEIDQTYQFLSTMKKGHVNLFLSFASLIAALIYSVFKELYEYWIFSLSFLIIIMILAFTINSFFYFRAHNKKANNELNEKKETLFLVISDTILINFEFFSKAIALIFSTNILILFVQRSGLVTVDTPLLNKEFFSLSLYCWIVIQVISIYIFTWFFSTKKKFLQSCTIFALHAYGGIKQLISKQKEEQPSLISQFIFLCAICIFGLSIPVFSFTLLSIQNFDLINLVIVIVAQIILLSFFLDHFSSLIVSEYCTKKLYQLEVLKSEIQKMNTDNSQDSETIENVSENLKITRLYFPVRFGWLIFFSSYLLIPNVALLTDDNLDLLKKYLDVEKKVIEEPNNE